MSRRLIATVALAAGLVALQGAPALAAHDHYIVTPNGDCRQVARGQTSIDDPAHGGYHKFHDNVHTGAAAPDNRTLGHGRAAVEVYKSADAPDICF